MTYDAEKMNWKWPGDASYSVYRKWCAGQPLLIDDDPASSCVATSGTTGCWEVIDCATPDLRYLCDLPNHLQCPYDKHSMAQLHQAALKEIQSIKESCNSCRRHHY